MSPAHKPFLSAAFFCAIFFTVANASAEEISFNDALSKMYNVNETIAAAESEIDQKKYERRSAIGLYFPKVSVSAAYIRFNDDLGMEVDIGGLKSIVSALPGIGALAGGLPSTLSQTVQHRETFTLDATLVWPVFTGGKIYAANKAGKLFLNMAEYKSHAVKEKLGAELASLYFGVRLAINAAQLRKEYYETVKDHYNKAVKMEKAGVLAKVERMHAETALSDAERALGQAQREVELADTALKSIINAEVRVMPSTPLFIIAAENVPPLEAFKEDAVNYNVQLKQLGIAQQLTDVALVKERATYFPTVFLFGMKSLYNYELTSLAPDWAVGVGVTFTIFEGLGGYNKVQAAKAAKRSVELTNQRANKDIKTLVEQQYITMTNARADFEAVRSSLAFTEEYLRARCKAFESGMATSLDVVDAELALSGAKMNALLAAYKFDVALAKLLETSGRFIEFEEYRLKASIEAGL